jgi:hypothetical protein
VLQQAVVWWHVCSQAVAVAVAVAMAVTVATADGLVHRSLHFIDDAATATGVVVVVATDVAAVPRRVATTANGVLDLIHDASGASSAGVVTARMVVAAAAGNGMLHLVDHALHATATAGVVSAGVVSAGVVARRTSVGGMSAAVGDAGHRLLGLVDDAPGAAVVSSVGLCMFG